MRLRKIPVATSAANRPPPPRWSVCSTPPAPRRPRGRTPRRGNAHDALVLLRERVSHNRDLHDKYAFAYSLVFLAAAAVLGGDDIWAARILGARDAVTERAGATVVDKTVQDVRDRVEREVRARLGPDRWDRAYSAGRTTSIDSLMKDIDSAHR